MFGSRKIPVIIRLFMYLSFILFACIIKELKNIFFKINVYLFT